MHALRRIWDSPWPALGFRVLLAGVFTASGILKLADPGALAATVKALGLAPGWAALPLSALLAGLEVLAGLGLLLGLRWSLPAITGMLLFFIAILAYALHMGLDIDCGCFGPDEPEARAFHGLWPALWRDLGLLAGAAWLHAWNRAHGVRGRGVGAVLSVFHDKPRGKEECAR
ncbi:MAG: MauE/DoxX family redox-associated membrane protein [Thermodesulfobacteriota bacterium]